jgi:hypothetical protein
VRLVVWNIVGGVYGHSSLAVLHRAEHPCGTGTGMKGVARVSEWKERIAENPANEDRLLSFDSTNSSR